VSQACEHPHGYEFDVEVCPICGWSEPEPGTIHDGAPPLSFDYPRHKLEGKTLTVGKRWSVEL
jgi:hypothetical protein